MCGYSSFRRWVGDSRVKGVSSSFVCNGFLGQLAVTSVSMAALYWLQWKLFTVVERVSFPMTEPDKLLRWGLALEYTTLAWNVVGVAVVIYAALQAHSVALTGFGLDSLIEIGASMVVIWELTGAGKNREKRRFG